MSDELKANLLTWSVSILTAIIALYTQLPKIRSDVRTEAEKADDLIFQRLTHEREEQDVRNARLSQRIDELVAALEKERTERINLFIELRNEQVIRKAIEEELRKNTEMRLESEKGMASLLRELEEERNLRRNVEAKLEEERRLRVIMETRVQELELEVKRLTTKTRTIENKVDTGRLDSKSIS